MTKLKAAMLQSHVYSDKAENIRALCVNLEELAKEKPDLVTLPEMFNCPYQSSNFPVYAEKEGEETWQALSSLAAKYLVISRLIRNSPGTSRQMFLGTSPSSSG